MAQLCLGASIARANDQAEGVGRPRGLFVQFVGARSARVCWETAQPGPSVVEWGTTEGRATREEKHLLVDAIRAKRGELAVAIALDSHSRARVFEDGSLLRGSGGTQRSVSGVGDPVLVIEDAELNLDLLLELFAGDVSQLKTN